MRCSKFTAWSERAREKKTECDSAFDSRAISLEAEGEGTELYAVQITGID